MSAPLQVRFIGGPSDGLTMPWHADEPPPSIRLPVERKLPPIGVPQELKLELDSPRNALYYLARDERGYPSRADDGALRYEYHS